jgi:uncharacterized Tic20 family protein
MTKAAPPRARSVHDERLWASVSHLGGILGPLPALGVYLAHRRRPGLVRQEAKEALNWQITASIGYALLLAAAGVVWAAFALASLAELDPIAVLIPSALYVVNVALCLTGSSRVNAGSAYRYPFAIRFIK